MNLHLWGAVFILFIFERLPLVRALSFVSLPSNNGTQPNQMPSSISVDSPNSWAVGSMAPVSDWVVTSCNASSGQAQTVLAYCSKSMNNSGCADVFNGGAEHTVIQMPQSCGLGPYARIVSLVSHANQSILSGNDQAQKPTEELVYSLAFDYNFSAIPASNGPIYLRADVANIPGYWDNIVDSPPERKRWLREREMKTPLLQRRLKSYTSWLSTLATRDEVGGSVSHTFTWSNTWPIFQASLSCTGNPSFQASLDVDVTGTATSNTTFGFYLEATIIPPAVQTAYLFLNADSTVDAAFTIKGDASVSYTSQSIQLVDLGFPGLSYPGLLTVGPSLVVSGYIAGQVSLQGTVEVDVQMQLPPVNISLSSSGNSYTGTPLPTIGAGTGTPNVTFGAGVVASGDVEVHLVPTIQLGISVLDGAVINAQAYIKTDLYGGIGLNASVSTAQTTPKACYHTFYGIDFSGGLTGSVLYWANAGVSWPFYQAEYTLTQACWNIGQGIAARDMTDLELGFAQPLPVAKRAQESEQPGYILERSGNGERYIYPVSRHSSTPAIDLLVRDDSLFTERAVMPMVTASIACPKL